MRFRFPSEITPWGACQQDCPVSSRPANVRRYQPRAHFSVAQYIDRWARPFMTGEPIHPDLRNAQVIVIAIVVIPCVALVMESHIERRSACRHGDGSRPGAVALLCHGRIGDAVPVIIPPVHRYARRAGGQRATIRDGRALPGDRAGRSRYSAGRAGTAAESDGIVLPAVVVPGAVIVVEGHIERRSARRNAHGSLPEAVRAFHHLHILDAIPVV